MPEEYRQIVNGSPVDIDAERLLELEAAIKRGLQTQNVQVEFEVTHKDRSVSADSAKGLLSKNVPAISNQLSVTAYRWNSESDIDAGVSMTFYRNYVSYQPHANDEGTFLATKRQLNEFLKNSRPWYWPAAKFGPVVFPLISFALVITSLRLLKTGVSWVAAAWGTAALVTIALTLLIFFQVVFPYVRVRLEDKQHDLALREIIGAMITLAALLASGIDLFLWLVAD